MIITDGSAVAVGEGVVPGIVVVASAVVREASASTSTGAAHHEGFSKAGIGISTAVRGPRITSQTAVDSLNAWRCACPGAQRRSTLLFTSTHPDATLSMHGSTPMDTDTGELKVFLPISLFRSRLSTASPMPAFSVGRRGASSPTTLSVHTGSALHQDLRLFARADAELGFAYKVRKTASAIPSGSASFGIAVREATTVKGKPVSVLIRVASVTSVAFSTLTPQMYVTLPVSQPPNPASHELQSWQGRNEHFRYPPKLDVSTADRASTSETKLFSFLSTEEKEGAVGSASQSAAIHSFKLIRLSPVVSASKKLN
eukprot:2531094-Rhodomonas_salina.1